MRSTAVLNQAYALGISTSGKSPGIFWAVAGAFRLSVSLTPSFHVSGKPRKGLGFHCFLTYPNFPIPPICPQPPQRYRPFDFERGYSDFTKKYPADDFERKKILQGILAIQWLCVSGEKPGENYYQIPHPQPPRPRKSQMVGLLTDRRYDLRFRVFRRQNFTRETRTPDRQGVKITFTILKGRIESIFLVNLAVLFLVLFVQFIHDL